MENGTQDRTEDETVKKEIWGPGAWSVIYNAYVDAKLQEDKEKRELIQWILNFHNVVNERTNKSKMTYQDAYEIYMKQRDDVRREKE